MKKFIPAVLLLAAAPLASANLVDPSFELNPLTNYYNVLGNFAGYQGQWGDESSTIVGATGGVTPAAGVKMLSMTDDGLIATQTVQMTSLTNFTVPINNGVATIDLSALFNVDSNVPAAIGGVALAFFSGPQYGSMIGNAVGNGVHFDANPLTWESSSLHISIPPGAKWVMSQVSYNNNTLLGHAGYVDAADLNIVPSPSGAALLALAGGVGLRRRR